MGPEDRSPGDRPPSLSATDTRILQVLADNPGRVLSRETLMRTGGIDAASARRVDSSMVVLRRLLGPESIRTVRRRGWMLTEDGHREAQRFLSA